MLMTFYARNFLRWVMRRLHLDSGAAHAEESLHRHVMQKAGALVWRMMEIHTDFGHKRNNRRMTTERVRKYARNVAKQLARSRNALAQLHRGLPPKDAFASDLAKFLTRWPDEHAFYDSLFSEETSYAENLGAQLYGLGSQAHDPRRKWKTPFPFFRP